MAEKHGLEALQERSAAALRQRDLVGLAVALAKTETPSKAYRTALAYGWPTRLAKAVQSLATVRRDYGLEAFEAFVSSFEHARSLLGETEHAQETRMSRERRLRAIAKLTYPAAKLRLMVKHGLTEDANALVDGLLADEEVSFWFNTNSATYPIRFQDDDAEKRTTRSDDTVHVLFCEKGVTPPGGDNNPITPDCKRDNSVTVVLDELATALAWDADAKKRFVRRALTCIAKRDQVYRHHDCDNATQHVRDEYLDSNDDIGRKIDLIVLRTRFRKDRPYALGHYYPVDVSHLGWIEKQGDAAIEIMLDRAIDLFIELGLSMDEVRQEFLWWLKNRPGTWPGWIFCFANARCFTEADDEERYQALRTYLPQAWDFAIRANNDSWTLTHVANLGPVGLYRNTTADKQGDEPYFRGELVRLLSEGQAGKVFEALVTFGDVAGLNPETSWEESKGKKAAAECLNALAPDAFSAAYEADRYGVAAALTKQFHCFPAGVRDRKAEVLQLAEDLEQPIMLAAPFDVGEAAS